MKSIRDSCIQMLQSEDTRKNLREVVKPISNMIYNEVYPYMWLLCIYYLGEFMAIDSSIKSTGWTIRIFRNSYHHFVLSFCRKV